MKKGGGKVVSSEDPAERENKLIYNMLEFD